MSVPESAYRATAHMSARDAARSLGVSEREALSHRHALGLTRPRKRVSPEEAEACRPLYDDGVPLTWIAETVGASTDTARNLYGKSKNTDWASVWQEIRRNDVLLELHREFAPKRG